MPFVKGQKNNKAKAESKVETKSTVSEEVNNAEKVVEPTKVEIAPKIKESELFMDDSPLLNQVMIERPYAMKSPAEAMQDNQDSSQTITQEFTTEQPKASEPTNTKTTSGTFEMGGGSQEQSPLAEPASNSGAPTPDEFKFDIPKNDLGAEGLGGDSMGGGGAEPLPEIPTQSAKQIADFILNSANFIIPLLGNRFVTINIHEEYYEVSGFIQVINEQNERNIQRIKLTEEEKDYLRPILVAVIKEKHTQLSPTTQLMIAAGMIISKKTMDVIEIRKENKMLENKLVDMIRANRGEAKVEPEIKKDAK
jgi:hypothetical protein